MNGLQDHGCRTYEPGAIAELCGHYLGIHSTIGYHIVPYIFPDFLQIHRTRLGQTAAYDHPLRAEYVDETGYSASEIIKMFVHTLHGKRLTLTIQTGYKLAVDLTVKFKSTFHGAGSKTAYKRRCRGIMLQTSYGTACTPLAIGYQRHMAQLGTPVGVTAEQPAAYDDRTADTGAHGQEHNVAASAGRTIAGFAKSHEIGIVAHHHRKAGSPLHLRGQINPLPSHDILGTAKYYPVGGVYNSGRSYAYTLYVNILSQSTFHHSDRGFFKLFCHGLGRLCGERR